MDLDPTLSRYSREESEGLDDIFRGRTSIYQEHFLKTDQQGWMKGNSHTPLPSEYRNPPDFYHGYLGLIDLPSSLDKEGLLVLSWVL